MLLLVWSRHGLRMALGQCNDCSQAYVRRSSDPYFRKPRSEKNQENQTQTHDAILRQVVSFFLSSHIWDDNPQ